MKISPWHGEHGTIFYVINDAATEILCAAASREEAENYIAENSPDKQIILERAIMSEMYADRVDDLWIRDEVNFFLCTL